RPLPALPPSPTRRSSDLLIAIWAPPVGISSVVGHAFAIAAATFAPLLILGVWWTRLTALGAATGMGVGGVATGGAALLSVTDALDRKSTRLNSSHVSISY